MPQSPLFDLVFVFAVTQLSHLLLHDVGLIGALHAAIQFLAVWWAWIYTSWVTNWLDPEHWPVRRDNLLGGRLGGLVAAPALSGVRRRRRGGLTTFPQGSRYGLNP